MTPRIGLILLAAGGSSRMGRPKQLLPFGNATLIGHAADTALVSGCDPVVVVLGASADLLEAELAGLPVRMVRNPDWHAGMGTSIRAGIAALDQNVEAAILMLADQPLVGESDLRSLCRAFADEGHPIVAASYDDDCGPPALFAREFFPLLGSLKDNEGAKRIIVGAGESALRIPMPHAGRDIDTPEDYGRLKQPIGRTGQA